MMLPGKGCGGKLHTPESLQELFQAACLKTFLRASRRPQAIEYRGKSRENCAPGCASQSASSTDSLANRRRAGPSGDVELSGKSLFEGDLGPSALNRLSLNSHF